MEIVMYKCPHTGKIFEDKSKFEKHVSKIEKEVEDKKAISSLLKTRDEARLTATSIKDFEQKMFEKVNELNKGNKDRLLFLEFSNLRFSEFVSNTHSNPIDGVQNWGRKSGIPIGYKGWYGRITLIYSEERNTGEFRDRVEGLVRSFPGYNSGSGGYNGNEYAGIKGYVLSYSASFFLSDFPLIEEQYNRYITLLEARQQFENSVEELCNNKNNSDEELGKLSEEIEAKELEMSKLRSELIKLQNKSYHIINNNNNQIREENRFEFEDELDNITMFN